MSRKNLLTLSDKISELLNKAPTVPDPEDDAHEATNAKVDDELPEYEIPTEIRRGKLRQQNLELLETADRRYSGRKGSRKDLLSDEESEISDVLIESEQDDSGEPSEESDDENEDVDESEDDEGSENEEVNDKEDSEFQHMKTGGNQVSKGNSVKSQLLIWETLLETRIKLQKCLVLGNRMPQGENFEKICTQGGEELNNKITETQQSLKYLLNGLIDLQDVLLKSYPETKGLGNKAAEKGEGSDEEIPSDTEGEEELEDVEEPLKKKPKLISDNEGLISKQHQIYTPYRNNIIRKWNEKTRISVAKNLVNSNSIINQIEYILKDREKCIKRTQLKRSNYTIIGEEIEEKTDNSLEQNSEIFDDDDFYHQLLRELIEFKSSDITDPVKLSRQWIQLQSMRSKMKRNIDTKATKGRRIRYAVHQKLVNYLAPIPDIQWTENAKTELFNSLFGNKIKNG